MEYMVNFLHYRNSIQLTFLNAALAKYVRLQM